MPAGLVAEQPILLKMGEQFPEVLDIRTEDPMLLSKGIDPIFWSAAAIEEQAAGKTATIAIEGVTRSADSLDVAVTVTSLVGH